MYRQKTIRSFFSLPAISSFLPFAQWTGLVTRNSLKADAIAGLTGAVIVLPQGVAFAMIAGLPPQYGLYTAIVTPIVAALFGSSRHLISGPTTAISIVVFSAISGQAQPGSPQFLSMALTLTFLAGLFQFSFGVARLGRLVDFVSHSVIVGFTAGAAILIATSQISHVTGITLPRGEAFLQTWQTIFLSTNDISVYVLIISVATLIIALVIKKFLPRWPHLLLAMIAGSFLSLAIDGPDHGVLLVGELPAQLPPISLPDFTYSTLRNLTPDAFAIAMLGLIEAVSISRSIATKSRQRINGNQEFIGQGLSNMVGSFFSSYAGSGSFTRSGINYAAGAKTPMAAIFAAVFLAFIILLIAPLTKFLPIPAMGGVILLVAYNLIDFHHIRTILRVSRSESMVLVLTFFATLFLELEFAIYAGVLFSLVLYLNRTAHPRIISIVPNLESSPRRFVPVAPWSDRRCPQLDILEINGAVFFGSVETIVQRLAMLVGPLSHHRHVLLEADSINLIDISGAEMLAQQAVKWRERGGGLYICGLKLEDKIFLKRGGYLDIIGRENIFHSKKTALPIILNQINADLCRECPHEVFSECSSIKKKPPPDPDTAP
ncbi:MAG TPA: SulP family inorganic anion transporter [Rhodospirillales bacterium]|nr:SulP family inorganic anion transporter [Rhodospirillales bacterium]